MQAAARLPRAMAAPRSLWIAALVFCSLLAGAHTGKLDEGPEVATEQVKEEALLEVKFAKLRKQYGIEDRRTLTAFFELFDLWIMLYRLNKIDAVLVDIMPACEWRRDEFTFKAVQALAFTRWKQGRYREALERFHEMEGWMGKHAALVENIGHTYNTIGQYDEAERYFKDALTLTKLSAKHRNETANEGGILLGLAGVQDRRGRHLDALPTAVEAYEFFKGRDLVRGWDTSLTAKAAMQVSKLQLKLGNLSGAETFSAEALKIFELTAGEDSPLVVGALDRLGSIYIRLGRREEARKSWHRAYKVASVKDALDLVEILELHNALLDTHIKGVEGLDRKAFTMYFDIAKFVVERVRAETKQDGNAGAYYKAAGELLVLGGDCKQGRPLLSEAAELFAAETSIDTTGLVRQCRDLMSFCDGTLEPQSKDSGGGSRGGRGKARSSEL